MTGKRVGVIIGPHATERFVERFGHELGSTKIRDVTSLIYAEVQQAIEAGRRAKTKPAWASIASRTTGLDGSRYVWNEEQSRVYVISRMRNSVRSLVKQQEFDVTWVVRTVLPRREDEPNEDLEHVHRYKQETSKSRQYRRGRQGKT